MDMVWIASMGHTVVGIEFVEEAIEQFFQEQKISFSIKQIEDFKVFTVSFYIRKFVNLSLI